MNDLHYDGRILLIYLAVKYKGDFEKVLSALIMKDIDVPYEEAMKVFKSLPCQVITYLDYDYPKKLKQVYRPPLVLFYYGDISLLEKQNIAVVGSRKYSDYGKECTEKVVSSIIKGRVLVSGLAKGIDSIAHQCAIDSGGKIYLTCMGWQSITQYAISPAALCNTFKQSSIEIQAINHLDPCNQPFRSKQSSI